MSGTQKLSGYAVNLQCSPPFGDSGGSSDNSFNVYRACVGDAAGQATLFSDFSDGATVIDQVNNPVISPDRSLILFEARSNITGFHEIWVTDNTPGSTPTQLLSSGTRYYLYPSWHPDSNQFVFVLGSSGGAISGGAIIKASVTSPGTTTTLKTASGGRSPYRPQFNFDGSRVAYNWAADIGTAGSLRVMDDDGTNDAQLDGTVRYRFQGPEFSWAHAMNVIAYDDGQNGVNASYVINDDGTGQVQINSAGSAAGANCRVSDRAWPSNDGWVIYGAQVLTTQYNPIRAELDGSTTSTLNASHGAMNQDYFRQILVADNRIWFIETTLSSSKLASTALDGTDYRVDLTVNGVTMDEFGSGNGWYYN